MTGTACRRRDDPGPSPGRPAGRAETRNRLVVARGRRGASGVCADMRRALRETAQWMRDNGASAGLVEEVRLAAGATSRLPCLERTGTVLRARRYRDGRVRWARFPGAGTG